MPSVTAVLLHRPGDTWNFKRRMFNNAAVMAPPLYSLRQQSHRQKMLRAQWNRPPSGRLTGEERSMIWFGWESLGCVLTTNVPAQYTQSSLVRVRRSAPDGGMRRGHLPPGLGPDPVEVHLDEFAERQHRAAVYQQADARLREGFRGPLGSPATKGRRDNIGDGDR